MISAEGDFPRLFILILLLSFLSGCASTPRHEVPFETPVYQAPLLPSAVPAGIYHTVERGQTLYRIGKTYGVDVDDLMRVNGIIDPGTLEVGQKLYIPGARTAVAVTPYQPTYSEADIRAVVGPRRTAYVWKTITVHHSATLNGSAALFHKDHLRRGMGGLFYHFVIGNGTYTPDGIVEPGFRWKQQKPANRANDIQICLVGDFSRQQVGPSQLASLAHLINILHEQYGIPLSGIRMHRSIPGKQTECPGKNFPFEKLLARLRIQQTGKS